jgi:hypothetical protein
MVCTAAMGIALLSFYADDVRTSQEAQASSVCYGGQLYFLYVNDVRASQEKTYVLPWTVIKIALPFYMQIFLRL